MIRGLCSSGDREKCRLEFGDNLDWACENCEKRQAQDLHPYTHKLLVWRLLIGAGYPLSTEDLEYQEWLDLGRISEAMAELKASRGMGGGCPLMGVRTEVGSDNG